MSTSPDSCGGNCLTSPCPACPAPDIVVDVDAKYLRDTLIDLANKVDELMNYADDEGYRAVAHKLQEAWGPLDSAVAAAAQYTDGTLERR